MRAPRKASAASRSSMPCAQATTVSEWSLAWRMDNNTVPAKVLAPRSEGCRYQRLDENSASGLLRGLEGRVGGQGRGSQNRKGAGFARHADEPRPFQGALSSLLGGLLDQAVHGRRGLGAHALPVRQTVLHDAQAFFGFL